MRVTAVQQALLDTAAGGVFVLALAMAAWAWLTYRKGKTRG